MARRVRGEKEDGRSTGTEPSQTSALVDGRPPQGAEALLAGLTGDARAAAVWETLQELKAPRRLELVQSVAERRDSRAGKLLAASLWDENAAVTLAAVDGLRTLGDPDAGPALEWLAEISRIERVATAAQATAAELRASAAERTSPPENAGTAAALHPRGEKRLAGEAEYWASFVDGDGAQLLMAVRPSRGGGDGERLRFAMAAVSDQRGIVEVLGADSAPQLEVEALRSAGSRCSGRAGGTLEALPREIGWVPVDGAYCGAAIEAAHRIHRRDRRRLPGSWEFWRADLCELAARPEDVLALDDRALPEGQLRRRLPQTASLIHFEGFRSWLILGEDLVPFLPAAIQALRRRTPDREERLAQVLSACLACVGKAPKRRLWRSRLLRQAALWERRGDRIVRELCLAAAWGLDERNKVPSEEHPLLRAMARASLEWVIRA